MPKTSPYARLSAAQAKRMLRELDRAVDYAEGWSGLAALLSKHTGEPISPQALFRWSVNGIPAERAVELERATGGLVLRQNLRPDLYDGMRSE